MNQVMNGMIYCPVCGKNIRLKRICPDCGYEWGRDYEVYPTLNPIPDSLKSIQSKHMERNKQWIYAILQEWHLENMEKQILSEDIIEKYEQKKDIVVKGDINSNNTLQEISKKQRVIKIEGNECIFGSYPQNVDGTYSPIKWKVLKIDNKEHKALLIAEKILDWRIYYNDVFHDAKSVNWAMAGHDKRGIRHWLNQEFYYQAFPEETQRDVIIPTALETHSNPIIKRTNGNATTVDRIFLLSIEEVIEYFIKEETPAYIDRKQGYARTDGYNIEAAITDYVKSKLTFDQFNLYRCRRWWLRSSGNSGKQIAFVDVDGRINIQGMNVDERELGIRPAMWVNLEK